MCKWLKLSLVTYAYDLYSVTDLESNGTLYEKMADEIQYRSVTSWGTEEHGGGKQIGGDV